MQWVRLLEQGSAGLARLKGQTTEFGTAANDNMVTKAREFDEAWNRSWTNFSLGWKSAFVGAAGILDSLIQKGRTGLMAVGVNVGANLLKNGLGTPLTGVGDDFYKATGATGRTDPNATKDPNAIKKQISDRQTYLSLLGSTLSAEQAAEQVRLQADATYLSTGQKVSADKLSFLQQQAREQALGITAIKASTDAMNVDAATVGMSVGSATALAAAQNAINDAKRAGRPLSEDNIAAIQREATALGEAAQRADTLRWGYEGLVRGPLQTFQQQLSNGATFFDALKASGLSALNAISSMLMDMAAQNLWKAALGGGSGGGLLSLFGLGSGSSGIAGGAPVPTFGAAGDYAVPTFHTGFGPGDAIRSTRYVHPAHFNDAPRFHSGIGPGERAAIIRKDESVLTPGQMRAVGGAKAAQPVVINNYNTFNGADPGSEARMRAYVDQSSQRTVQQAVQAVSQVKSTTPNYASGVR